MKRELLFSALLSSAFPALAISQEAQPIARSPATLEQFENGLPVAFSAATGQLSLSPDHAKDGTTSLKWNWREQDSLTIRHAFAFRPFVPNGSDQRRDGITFWIYSPQALKGEYRFQFYKGDRAASSFKMGANFSGWRAAVVSFETDMDGQPLVGMDRLVITPPEGAKTGTALIDQFGLDMRIDPRHPAADYQLPHLNKGAITAANRHWTGLIHFDRWLQQARPTKITRRPEAANVESIKALIDRDLLIGKAEARTTIAKATRELIRADGSIRPLSETSHQWRMYADSGASKESIDALRASTATWKDFGINMRAIAVAYRLSKDEVERERLSDLFLRLNNHLVEQGLVRGSGQGLMHHQGYILTEWSQALYLMRDALGDRSEEAQQALGYYIGLGRIYEPTETLVEFNIDVMNTLLQPMLYSILMENDVAKRDGWLADMSAWMSRSTLVSLGLAGGFKPDGSAFHHGQHYVAYANGGLSGVTAAVRYLAGSPFAISDEAYALIRDSVLKSRIYSNDGLIPMSLTGRHPDGLQSIAIAPFASLAEAKGAADPEMVSAFLRLLSDPWAGKKSWGPGPADRRLAREFIAKGVKAETDPQGSWTMNYSSMALHRRAGWLLAARGHSRYLAGNESYDQKNLYGRYINYGALEFMPDDATKRSFDKDGWNWNRWPGTTAIQQPLDRLKANVLNVEPAAGVEEMLLSEESYSGGLDFRGQQSMFAMKLQGHSKYRDDMVARKSYFMFDNRVVALGSGITATDKQSPVQTTLFQDKILPGSQPAAIDGVSTPWTTNDISLKLSSRRFIQNERGNGFCLAPGQTIAFRRGIQESIDESGNKPTRGSFTSAVLDHGIAPKGGQYEYAMFVGMAGDQGRKLCNDLGNAQTAPYTVIAQTNRAHVVHDRSTGVTGYALFEAGPTDRNETVLSVSSPSMIMLQPGERKLSGSFVNPDLNLYQGKDPEQYDATGARRERIVYGLSWMEKASQPIKTTVMLKGRWQLARPVPGLSVATVRGNTELRFTTRDAMPVQFDLIGN